MSTYTVSGSTIKIDYGTNQTQDIRLGDISDVTVGSKIVREPAAHAPAIAGGVSVVYDPLNASTLGYTNTTQWFVTLNLTENRDHVIEMVAANGFANTEGAADTFRGLIVAAMLALGV